MNVCKYISLIILASFCLSLTPIPFHEVKYVYDGDTIRLDNGEHIRYLGINAPEMARKDKTAEFLARPAREFNRKLVGNALVRLEYDQEKRDRYNRLLAFVFLENGDMVNALMVRKGFAHVMSKKKNLKYRDLLLDLQRKAMKERLGIWSAAFQGTEDLYLGNRRSYLFHKKSCPFGAKTARGNRVTFKPRYNASREGYSPCNNCRP
ncbi:MAG: hypothetical protein GY864_08180 [Desulfobacterales bacterium]|nr:hypothetical protein [Desulfobacterales bacterium]